MWAFDLAANAIGNLASWIVAGFGFTAGVGLGVLAVALLARWVSRE